MGVVEEEADESAFWMEMIIEGELLKRELVDSLMSEAIELTKIMASSRISASSNATKRNERIAESQSNGAAERLVELPEEGISLEGIEKDLILRAMERTDYNITKAAKLLGLTFRTLQYRLEKFGLNRNRQSAIGNRQ